MVISNLLRGLLRLAPLAGRGRTALAGRVRGSFRELHDLLSLLIEAPHPNLLPVRTGRRGAVNKRSKRQ